jgi:hypothetical protein
MSNTLVFHGTVLLVIGLAAGWAYGQAIVHHEGERRVSAWRAAHTGLTGGGVLMIAMGAMLGLWSENGTAAGVVTWGLIVSGYAFAVAMPMAAITGHRGFTMRGPAVNWIAFVGHTLGVLGSVVSVLAFLVISWRHYAGTN